MTKKAYHHGDLRSALIEAAREELQASGIEKFSLRKVAARAGVSHAAPAHHFKDTSGLLTALASEGFRRFLAAMEKREAASDPDPQAQVVAAGLGYLDFASDEKALFRLIHASERPDFEDPELKAASQASFMHLLDVVARTMGKDGACIDGEDRCDEAEVYLHAAAVWSMAHGLADLLTNGRLTGIDQMTGEMRDRALKNILQRPLPLGAKSI